MRHIVRRSNGRAKDIRNHVRGVVAWFWDIANSGRTVPDDVVAARVRAKLGHLLRPTNRVDVRVTNGLVTLEGTVAAEDIDLIIECVGAVPGVVHVNNELGSDARATRSLSKVPMRARATPDNAIAT
jgi:hypothetical protein